MGKGEGEEEGGGGGGGGKGEGGRGRREGGRGRRGEGRAGKVACPIQGMNFHKLNTYIHVYHKPYTCTTSQTLIHVPQAAIILYEEVLDQE